MYKNLEKKNLNSLARSYGSLDWNGCGGDKGDDKFEEPKQDLKSIKEKEEDNYKDTYSRKNTSKDYSYSNNTFRKSYTSYYNNRNSFMDKKYNKKKVDYSKIFYKKILLLFIFLILIILILVVPTKFKHTKSNKICICTLGKLENKYAREFVEFYQNLGIDKIILYDNNEIDGEKFEEVISDYINSGFVEIKDYRGEGAIQLKSINNCIKKYHKQYDWFFVVDMDEFIHIKENNIKEFLSLDRFKNCNVIHFNWKHHTDGDQIYYRNESLFKRFPNIIYRYPETVKSIMRSPKKSIYISNHHVLKYNDSCCLANGSTILSTDFTNNEQIQNPDYKDYYIDHFYTKTAEEYMEKKNRGDCFFGKDKRLDLYALSMFFTFNKITLEKIEFFEHKTGLNLSRYRRKLKNI